MSIVGMLRHIKKLNYTICINFFLFYRISDRRGFFEFSITIIVYYVFINEQQQQQQTIVSLDIRRDETIV